MSLPPRVLELLVRLGELRRDHRALAVKNAQIAHRQAAQTAQSLALFEAEQFARRRGATTSPMGVQALRIDQGFHRKLGEARRLQGEVLEASERNAEAARESLLAEQRRVAALEALLDARQRQAHLHTLRLEQRELDQIAARGRTSGPQD
ncbi:MAG: flagellar export protein FliJ [Burkholderiaceae bacterium]